MTACTGIVLQAVGRIHRDACQSSGGCRSMAVRGHTAGSRGNRCRVICHQDGAVMTGRTVVVCCRRSVMVDAAGENGDSIVADQAVVGMRGCCAALGRITVTIGTNLCSAVTACNGSMAQGTLAAVDIHDNVSIDASVVAACITAGGFRYAAVPWEVNCSMAAVRCTGLVCMTGCTGVARTRCYNTGYCG